MPNRAGPYKRHSRGIGTVILCLALVSGSLQTAAWAASNFKVLRSFGPGYKGGGLYSGLAVDAKGDLYSTSWGGGKNDLGTVFELRPSGQGGWKEPVLHSFDRQTDGGDPRGTLLLDGGGNLYGTTSLGGPNIDGVVFQMAHGAGGWSFTVIDDFGSHGGVIADNLGNLYGTIGPGEYNEGAVTELSSDAERWEQTYLYSFCPKISSCPDGDAPATGVVFDSDGNLYGTTMLGGTGKGGDWGTAYELKYLPDGSWKHIVLHSFPANDGDGKLVYGGLVVDKSGNLYGTTTQGGGSGCGGPGCGTVYELVRAGNQWKETVLYNFSNPTKGAGPISSLTFDASGNLWGTGGGGSAQCNGGCGVVFKMTPGRRENGSIQSHTILAAPTANILAAAWFSTRREISTAPPRPAAHAAMESSTGLRRKTA